MGIKSHIPFTQARRQRLFAMSLQKQRGKHEVLLQIEYPDGTEQHKPADWNSDVNCWETPDGQRWFSKGKGKADGVLNGVPIVHVDALNAGVISAEAAKIADREHSYDFVDEDGRELEVVETDEDGAPVEVRYADDEDGEPMAADGGEIDLHYDLGAPEGYAGEVIDRQLAGYYDPFPVSRQEADQAVEHAQAATSDQEGFIKTFLLGFALCLGTIVLLGILVWLMGEVGGGDGGSGASETIPAMLTTLGVMLP